MLPSRSLYSRREYYYLRRLHSHLLHSLHEIVYVLKTARRPDVQMSAALHETRHQIAGTSVAVVARLTVVKHSKARDKIVYIYNIDYGL